MKTLPALCLFASSLLACASLAAQQLATPTELPGDPFVIRDTWQIAPSENIFSGMTLDPKQLRLFVTYRAEVVAYDLRSGTATSKFSGLSGPSGIAFDSTGEFGFVTDWLHWKIQVFDQRRLEVVGFIQTLENPSMVVFEPRSELIFAFSAIPDTGPVSPSRPSSRPLELTKKSTANPHPVIPPARPEETWYVTVIDSKSWSMLAGIKLEGKVGFVHTAGNGHVYVGLPGANGIVRINSVELGERLRGIAVVPHDPSGRTLKDVELQLGQAILPDSMVQRSLPIKLDWSTAELPNAITLGDVVFLHAGTDCAGSRAAAVDEAHLRLFVACGDRKLGVLNADNGDRIATLPTGPDTRAIAYDFDRRTVYAANAAGEGSLTIIHQHATDTYYVVQNLPTPIFARALAVDPPTGLVYLLTDYRDLDSRQPALSERKGYFQISVIGHCFLSSAVPACSPFTLFA
jgi:DNA-binding beta-propeller fold protein YncE